MVKINIILIVAVPAVLKKLDSRLTNTVLCEFNAQLKFQSVVLVRCNLTACTYKTALASRESIMRLKQAVNKTISENTALVLNFKVKLGT